MKSCKNKSVLRLEKSYQNNYSLKGIIFFGFPKKYPLLKGGVFILDGILSRGKEAA